MACFFIRRKKNVNTLIQNKIFIAKFEYCVNMINSSYPFCVFGSLHFLLWQNFLIIFILHSLFHRRHQLRIISIDKNSNHEYNIQMKFAVLSLRGEKAQEVGGEFYWKMQTYQFLSEFVARIIFLKIIWSSVLSNRCEFRWRTYHFWSLRYWNQMRNVENVFWCVWIEKKNDESKEKLSLFPSA